MPPSAAALDEWLGFARQLADTAHALLKPAAAMRPEVEVKADRSFVTELDARIEARLRELIGARYPRHGILGEEQGASDVDAEAVWILDPIDGTAPFVAGVPVFGTLIALAGDRIPVLGVMHLPVTEQRWEGVAGRATTLNGAAAHAALRRPRPRDPDHQQPRLLQRRRTPGVRRTARAHRLAHLRRLLHELRAAGRRPHRRGHRHAAEGLDYAPFKPMIEGAGGVLSDWRGRPITLDSGAQILAAGDPARHAEALALVQQSLPT
jgi:inositol-phosphate phosphatase/L-galactose 1-phosphate phosphatase/histidinol-phosphatase